MGILKMLFIIFLALYGLGEVVRFALGNNLYIKPLDIVVVCLVGVWLVGLYKTNKKHITQDKLFIPITLFVVVTFISLLFNFTNYNQNEIIVGLSYILRWILYANLYFVVKSFPLKFKKIIIYIIFFGAALITLLGFIQYFFYSNLRNLYYLGWDEHMHRMFSTFLDPNFAGALFVMYLIFSLSMFLYFLKSNKPKWANIAGLFSIGSLMSIFLTYSRSALIMFFVSIVIFSVLTKKIYWVVGLILCFSVFILISSRNFNIENINLFRMASSEARLESAKVAIQIIAKNPLLGVGFNVYRYAQVRYGVKGPIGSKTSHADAGTDNSFLFVLATTGLIGFFFYLKLLGSILKQSYVTYKNWKPNTIQKYLSIAVISSIGGIIIDSFFINSLFYSFVMIWMWVTLGLIEKE